MVLDQPQPPKLLNLLAIGVSDHSAQTVTNAATRLNLGYNGLARDDAEFDACLEEASCVVLLDARAWDDQSYADLAARLALSSKEHGGIIASGQVDGVVSQHLSAAGWLTPVQSPLCYHELTAALVIRLDWLTKRRASLTDRRVSGALQVESRSLPGRSSHSDLGELLNGIMARRNARQGVFPDGLFSDPAWDVLLSLAQARIEARSTQASNIGIEAGIPPSTALRRVKDLEIAGLVDRWGDPNDRRRDFVQLSDAGLEAFIKYAAKVTEKHYIFQ